MRIVEKGNLMESRKSVEGENDGFKIVSRKEKGNKPIGSKVDVVVTLKGRNDTRSFFHNQNGGSTFTPSTIKWYEKAGSNHKDDSVRLSKWKQGMKTGNAFQYLASDPEVRVEVMNEVDEANQLVNLEEDKGMEAGSEMNKRDTDIESDSSPMVCFLTEGSKVKD